MKKDLTKEKLTNEILKTVYLNLQNFGYTKVSLKNEDLVDYVPEIERIINSYGLSDNNLFKKAPVTGIYNMYIDFLITQLHGNSLGLFDKNCETIDLNCPIIYIIEYKESMAKYDEIINKCCYAITKDNKFIDSESDYTINAKQKNKGY